MTPRKDAGARPSPGPDDLAAGRAAGYCWHRNPRDPGRCTRPPEHTGLHEDVYARTQW
ncbi:hypothetical protein [Streptomyces pseudovenezuelae]|uniref:hypothetical protein n=1 Tax=Streptomyces pseudovenezuelae TaxID=67350 RepID=UPI002E31F139|nr:hypothetical protein [Streptomyces pseudovenezuelae]